eukprot:355575-Chlamydomonas_euryale.AAC.2
MGEEQRTATGLGEDDDREAPSVQPGVQQNKCCGGVHRVVQAGSGRRISQAGSARRIVQAGSGRRIALAGSGRRISQGGSDRRNHSQVRASLSPALPYAALVTVLMLRCGALSCRQCCAALPCQAALGEDTGV